MGKKLNKNELWLVDLWVNPDSPRLYEQIEQNYNQVEMSLFLDRVELYESQECYAYNSHDATESPSRREPSFSHNSSAAEGMGPDTVERDPILGTWAFYVTSQSLKGVRSAREPGHTNIMNFYDDGTVWVRTCALGKKPYTGRDTWYKRGNNYFLGPPDEEWNLASEPLMLLGFECKELYLLQKAHKSGHPLWFWFRRIGN